MRKMTKLQTNQTSRNNQRIKKRIRIRQETKLNQRSWKTSLKRKQKNPPKLKNLKKRSLATAKPAL